MCRIADLFPLPSLRTPSTFVPTLFQIEADTQDDVVESFEVEEVPTFLILRVSCLAAG